MYWMILWLRILYTDRGHIRKLFRHFWRTSDLQQQQQPRPTLLPATCLTSPKCSLPFLICSTLEIWFPCIISWQGKRQVWCSSQFAFATLLGSLFWINLLPKKPPTDPIIGLSLIKLPTPPFTKRHDVRYKTFYTMTLGSSIIVPLQNSTKPLAVGENLESFYILPALL